MQTIPDVRFLPVTQVPPAGHATAEAHLFAYHKPHRIERRIRPGEEHQLPLFQEGIPSLAPDAGIVCYWDQLENLTPLIREGRLERNAAVTVEYQYIAGQLPARLGDRPRLYEDLRTQGYRNMDDLVDAVEKLSDDGIEGNNKG